VGVLTDSFVCTFFYFIPQEGANTGGDLYPSSKLIAVDAQSQEEILGNSYDIIHC